MLRLLNVARVRCCSTLTAAADPLTAPFAPCVSETGERILYPSHKPTTLSQRLVLTFGSCYMALTDTKRDDMVAVFGETTGHTALQSMRKRMLEDPTGREILSEKPRITTNTVDLDYLRTLPEDTFGKHYINFMDKYKLTPDARAKVKYVDDTELGYLMQRYREVHDLAHVINGMGIGLLGEIMIKWFEAIQTGLPMCVLAALGAPAKLTPVQKDVFRYKLLPWAISNGWYGKFYMSVYFEKHWEQPMESFRRELNLTAPPFETFEHTEPVY
ncbi:ubiquinone biosynthesis protein COQ4 homolog, mitochondrial-like isoform X2 [Dysidea avara]|uniref:ubiquinone biosynthesis protein COQ4 homolog, mitochondrial-like isoform X2 n=1 Tax=Dysidea avara TaxID=196820 RepID=UPI00331E0545